MSGANIKIRVKKGSNEIEIEAPASDLQDAIGVISEMLDRVPNESSLNTKTDSINVAIHDRGNNSGAIRAMRDEIPEVHLERDESLTSILSKLFTEDWGRTPKKLGIVREALQSYGLSYPKQSVAVALLRLAQSGKLRRFKDEGGEYVYTASTALITTTMSKPETIKLPESKQYI